MVLSDLQSRRAEHERAMRETEQAIASIERVIREIKFASIRPRAERPDGADSPLAGMTLGDAAATYIRSCGPGRPQSTREIVEALKRGGASTVSKNLFTTMYNVLSKRAERENGDIAKEGTGWTLREFKQQQAKD